MNRKKTQISLGSLYLASIFFCVGATIIFMYVIMIMGVFSLDSSEETPMKLWVLSMAAPFISYPLSLLPLLILNRFEDSLFPILGFLSAGVILFFIFPTVMSFDLGFLLGIVLLIITIPVFVQQRKKK